MTFSSLVRRGLVRGPALWPQAHPLPSASSTGQDHSSQGPQGHLPELAPTAERKGALPAASRRSHPLRQAGPTRLGYPKQDLPTPHTKQAPEQDFWMAGDELQCWSRNSWPWASEQGSRTCDQGYPWSAESNLQVPRPNPWTPEQDTRTWEWNSGALRCSLSSDPGRLSSARSFEQRLPATQPPKWTSPFSYPCS